MALTALLHLTTDTLYLAILSTCNKFVHINYIKMVSKRN